MNGHRPRIGKLFLGFVLCISLPLASCSKDKSEGSSEPVYTKIKGQTDPVAKLTAEIAIAALSPQGSWVETTTKEVRTKHGPEVEQLKGSLCETLRKASKKESSVRSDAEEAVRDSFVFNFIERAAAAPQETQVAVVQSLAIKSSGTDGAPLDGAAALKDASFTNSAGSTQLPQRGTPEYIRFADWMGKNDALLGFTDTVTKEYIEAIRDCSLD